MKKMLLTTLLALAGQVLFAQTGGTVRQFMLIVRYNMNVPPPDAETMKVNGQPGRGNRARQGVSHLRVGRRGGDQGGDEFGELRIFAGWTSRKT
jgi:hypothetical protein